MSTPTKVDNEGNIADKMEEDDTEDDDENKPTEAMQKNTPPPVNVPQIQTQPVVNQTTEDTDPDFYVKEFIVYEENEFKEDDEKEALAHYLNWAIGSLFAFIGTEIKPEQMDGPGISWGEGGIRKFKAFDVWFKQQRNNLYQDTTLIAMVMQRFDEIRLLFQNLSNEKQTEFMTNFPGFAEKVSALYKALSRLHGLESSANSASFRMVYYAIRKELFKIVKSDLKWYSGHQVYTWFCGFRQTVEGKSLSEDSDSLLKFMLINLKVAGKSANPDSVTTAVKASLGNDNKQIELRADTSGFVSDELFSTTDISSSEELLLESVTGSHNNKAYKDYIDKYLQGFHTSFYPTKELDAKRNSLNSVITSFMPLADIAKQGPEYFLNKVNINEFVERRKKEMLSILDSVGKTISAFSQAVDNINKLDIVQKKQIQSWWDGLNQIAKQWITTIQNINATNMIVPDPSEQKNNWSAVVVEQTKRFIDSVLNEFGQNNIVVSEAMRAKQTIDNFAFSMYRIQYLLHHTGKNMATAFHMITSKPGNTLLMTPKLKERVEKYLSEFIAIEKNSYKINEEVVNMQVRMRSAGKQYPLKIAQSSTFKKLSDLYKNFKGDVVQLVRLNQAIVSYLSDVKDRYATVIPGFRAVMMRKRNANNGGDKQNSRNVTSKFSFVDLLVHVVRMYSVELRCVLDGMDLLTDWLMDWLLYLFLPQTKDDSFKLKKRFDNLSSIDGDATNLPSFALEMTVNSLRPDEYALFLKAVPTYEEYLAAAIDSPEARVFRKWILACLNAASSSIENNYARVMAILEDRIFNNHGTMLDFVLDTPLPKTVISPDAKRILTLVMEVATAAFLQRCMLKVQDRIDKLSIGLQREEIENFRAQDYITVIGKMNEKRGMPLDVTASLNVQKEFDTLCGPYTKEVFLAKLSLLSRLAEIDGVTSKRGFSRSPMLKSIIKTYTLLNILHDPYVWPRCLRKVQGIESSVQEYNQDKQTQVMNARSRRQYNDKKGNTIVYKFQDFMSDYGQQSNNALENGKWGTKLFTYKQEPKLAAEYYTLTGVRSDVFKSVSDQVTHGYSDKFEAGTQVVENFISSMEIVKDSLIEHLNEFLEFKQPLVNAYLSFKDPSIDRFIDELVRQCEKKTVPLTNLKQLRMALEIVEEKYNRETKNLKKLLDDFSFVTLELYGVSVLGEAHALIKSDELDNLKNLRKVLKEKRKEIVAEHTKSIEIINNIKNRLKELEPNADHDFLTTEDDGRVDTHDLDYNLAPTNTTTDIAKERDVEKLKQALVEHARFVSRAKFRLMAHNKEVEYYLTRVEQYIKFSEELDALKKNENNRIDYMVGITNTALAYIPISDKNKYEVDTNAFKRNTEAANIWLRSWIEHLRTIEGLIAKNFSDIQTYTLGKSKLFWRLNYDEIRHPGQYFQTQGGDVKGNFMIETIVKKIKAINIKLLKEYDVGGEYTIDDFDAIDNAHKQAMFNTYENCGILDTIQNTLDLCVFRAAKVLEFTEYIATSTHSAETSHMKLVKKYSNIASTILPKVISGILSLEDDKVEEAKKIMSDDTDKGDLDAIKGDDSNQDKHFKEAHYKNFGSLKLPAYEYIFDGIQHEALEEAFKEDKRRYNMIVDYFLFALRLMPLINQTESKDSKITSKNNREITNPKYYHMDIAQYFNDKVFKFESENIHKVVIPDSMDPVISFCIATRNLEYIPYLIPFAAQSLVYDSLEYNSQNDSIINPFDKIIKHALLRKSVLHTWAYLCNLDEEGCSYMIDIFYNGLAPFKRYGSGVSEGQALDLMCAYLIKTMTLRNILNSYPQFKPRTYNYMVKQQHLLRYFVGEVLRFALPDRSMNITDALQEGSTSSLFSNNSDVNNILVNADTSTYVRLDTYSNKKANDKSQDERYIPRASIHSIYNRFIGENRRYFREKDTGVSSAEFRKGTFPQDITNYTPMYNSRDKVLNFFQWDHAFQVRVIDPMNRYGMLNMFMGNMEMQREYGTDKYDPYIRFDYIPKPLRLEGPYKLDDKRFKLFDNAEYIRVDSLLKGLIGNLKGFFDFVGKITKKGCDNEFIGLGMFRTLDKWCKMAHSKLIGKKLELDIPKEDLSNLKKNQARRYIEGRVIEKSRIIRKALEDLIQLLRAVLSRITVGQENDYETFLKILFQDYLTGSARLDEEDYLNDNACKDYRNRFFDTYTMAHWYIGMKTRRLEGVIDESRFRDFMHHEYNSIRDLFNQDENNKNTMNRVLATGMYVNILIIYSFVCHMCTMDYSDSAFAHRKYNKMNISTSIINLVGAAHSDAVAPATIHEYLIMTLSDEYKKTLRWFFDGMYCLFLLLSRRNFGATYHLF